MKEQLELIKSNALAALEAASTPAALDEVRVKWLGKKGELTAVLKMMGKLSAEERPVMGQLANSVRAEIETKLEQCKAAIGAAALEVPIFRSANMSLGINVLIELVKKAASVLGDSYDIEIVERHHRRKVDAPSGTALMIADAAASACGHDSEYVYERHSVRQPRDKKEIGISAVRGGTIVGEHEIIFAGHDEVMEIKHTALSREIFAQGAVEAAKFMATVETPGMYDMSMLVK